MKGLQGNGQAADPGLYDARPVTTHYEALGVPISAGASEIRQAYLAAARLHHPDFHLGADGETQAGHARQMQMINQAWEVLGDASARQRYDVTLRTDEGPPTERIRPNRDPVVPEGKGWTPRREDDGWQQDYRSWADQDERLAPDLPGARRSRGLMSVLPVVLFAVGILSGFLGLVLEARPLLAIAFVGVALSGALFVILPVLEMSRGRHRN